MNIFAALPSRYQVTSDPLRTERRVELAVLCLLVLLLVQLAWGALRIAFLSVPEPVHPAADSLSVDGVVQRPGISVEQSQEIRGRPVFWASRTPVEPVEVKQVKSNGGGKGSSKAKKLSQVKLVGVFGAGETAGIIAIIKSKKQRIIVGEEVDGWKLASIGPSEARFAAGGREQVIVLDRGEIAARKTSADSASGAGAGEETGTEDEAPASPPTEALQNVGLRLK